MTDKLNIQSIFDSIDGEANGFDGAGQLCTFIRLKGCNFRPGCSYCLAGNSIIKIVDENHRIIHKRIHDVEVGQKVLGFDFKQNRIVETQVDKKFVHEVDEEELLRIEFDRGMYRTLYVTRDHLFYSGGQWVSAEKLKVGDEIYTSPQSYLNIFTAKFRDNKALGVKVSKARIGKYPSEETKVRMRKSAKTRERNLSPEQKRSRAVKGYITRSKRGRISGCEKYFIELFSEYPIRHTGNGKVWIGGKNPDFIVVGQKKVIEVTDKTAIFRDFDNYKKKRTAHFEKYGYKCLVLSIPEYSWRVESKNKVKSIITNFIMNGRRITKISTITIRQCARISLDKKYNPKVKVYNLECSPYHNYFVNGILSHNCDTTYAQESEPANWMTIDEIMKQVHFPKITITGGEPFYQLQKVGLLIYTLVSQFKNCLITIETNGSIDPADFAANYFKSMGKEGRETVRKTFILPYFDANSEYKIFYLGSRPNVRLVVDFKLPSSGVEEKMNLNLFKKLRGIDVIKFVIADEKDYKRACELIEKNPNWIAKKVMSPATEIKKAILPFRFISEGFWCKSSKDIDIVDNEWPQQLVEMMIRDRVPAQFSLQLHKILWPGAKEER